MIADLPGRKSGVVLLGGHLDSVANGPGINDNGSGSALVLEVARQARRLHFRPKHGLRFAFWGGEELGLLGSTSYAQSLSARQRRGILDVLNFDMVGSPNFGRIVYNGRGQPSGSVAIENAFRAYFAARRLPVEEASLGGASDHASFAQAGIPVGGLFTGADEEKAAGLGPALRGHAELPVRRLLPQGLRHGREYRLRCARADDRGRRGRGAAPRRLARARFSPRRVADVGRQHARPHTPCSRRRAGRAARRTRGRPAVWFTVGVVVTSALADADGSSVLK